MDRVFLGLAGLLLGIYLGLCPQEIPLSSPASPRKTPSIPPLLLGLTQSQVFQAIATVCHCWTSFMMKIKLDHFCIGNGSYIDIHKFIWA